MNCRYRIKKSTDYNTITAQLTNRKQIPIAIQTKQKEMRSHSNTISTKRIRHSRPKRTGQPAGRDLWTLFSTTDRPKAHIQASAASRWSTEAPAVTESSKATTSHKFKHTLPLHESSFKPASRTRDSEGHTPTYQENTRTSYQYLHKHKSVKTVPSPAHHLGKSR